MKEFLPEAQDGDAMESPWLLVWVTYRVNSATVRRWLPQAAGQLHLEGFQTLLCCVHSRPSSWSIRGSI